MENLEGFLTTIVGAILAVVTVVLAVLCWIVRGIGLALYYAFVPHRDYCDFLGW